MSVQRLCNDISKKCVVSSKMEPAMDFVERYENPVSWHKKYDLRDDLLRKDVLFDNMDMKSITMAQYDPHNLPEYIKWRLFGYNIVICYEYISKGNNDDALKIINDIENILSSIGNNDPFLKSIKVALNHITFSMKGHLWHLCSMDIKKLEHFVMPINMNNANKAGLYGVQTLFFYEYDLPYAHIAKNSALKAIELNNSEPEWHFLLARVLTYWQRTCGNYFECSEQEINASERAVKLGDKPQHKLHLIHIYHRMSKNMKKNINAKNEILDAGLQLLNEVMNSTNDLLLLKNCLLSLSKISLDKDFYSNNISEILETLISKLESTNNGYVHGAIGNYYLFNKKDIEKANFHLKKAYDVKSFGCSIDYIYTLYLMNPNTAPVEQMMVDMLKTFTHPVHREKILSQVVSYLIVTKNNLIQALKYIPILLSFKNVTCVYSLQTHRLKFYPKHKSMNLIDLLSERLDAALKDSKLPADHKKRVVEVLQIFEPFKMFVSNLMQDKSHLFGNNFKKDSSSKSNRQFNQNSREKESWKQKSHTQNNTYVKINEKQNWRTLKPDSNPNPHVFSNQQKDIKNNGVKIKSRFDF
uniref:Uncharacterized protein n=1 Tax=Sipha flava TaxID=143950 RepID=A0A2S2PXU8_9HEMI